MCLFNVCICELSALIVCAVNGENSIVVAARAVVAFLLYNAHNFVAGGRRHVAVCDVQNRMAISRQQWP